MKTVAIGLGLAVLGIAFGCTETRPGVLYGPPQVLDAKDYPSVLGTWTRGDKIYSGFDTRLFVTATYHSPEFRRGFAEAFPGIYGHGGKITRRELVDLTGDVEQFHNFFVSVYTPNARWNDLAKPDSIWNLTLHGNDDTMVKAHEILPIKIDENLRLVYPYIGAFDKTYLVRFRLADPLGRMLVTPQSTAFRIELVSALGTAQLDWKLVALPEVKQARK